MKDLFDARNYLYSQILVTVKDPDNIEITTKKADDSLRRLHKDEAYTVFMMKSILESIGATKGDIQMIFMLESGLLGFVSDPRWKNANPARSRAQ